MPRAKNPIPTYRKHTASGQAIAVIDGKPVYLGMYNSPESKDRYARLIAEMQASPAAALTRGPAPGATGAGSDITIAEVMVAFVERHVSTYYLKDGKPTGEQANIRNALRILKRLYGSTPVCDFGPLRLKAVRQSMIAQGHSRGHINKNIGRVKAMFRWGVETELVNPSIYQALAAVAGLKRGRSEAQDPPPVRPAADWLVDAVIPHVSRQVGAMIQLQRTTGMRPGEVVILRTGDVDRTGPVWIYTPREHKTEHHSIQRTVAIGPRGQAILRPFLKMDLTAYCFDPREAEAERRAEATRQRKTAVNRGNAVGSNRRRKPRRTPGERYDVYSYRRAIERGTRLAFPLPDDLASSEKKSTETLKVWQARTTEKQRREVKEWRREHAWHPHQLRHSKATELRKKYGIEAARVALGHQDLKTSEIYAEADSELAKKVALEVG